MKKILFILLAIFMMISAKSYSQSYTYANNNSSPYERGYIYLKNGEVLQGKYIYSSDLKKIQIVTKEMTIVIDADEVEKITKKKFTASQKPSKPKEPEMQTLLTYEPSNFFNITEVGLLAGNPDNQVKNPMIVHTSFNYNFYKNLSAGLGTGLEFYKETYLPMTVNVMYKYGKKRTTPYAIVQGGYNIPISDTRLNTYQTSGLEFYPTYSLQELKATGGFLVNPAIGFIYQINEGLGFGLSLGYRFHALNYTTDTAYRLQISHNRLSIKLSFIFN